MQIDLHTALRYSVLIVPSPSLPNSTLNYRPTIFQILPSRGVFGRPKRPRSPSIRQPHHVSSLSKNGSLSRPKTPRLNFRITKPVHNRYCSAPLSVFPLTAQHGTRPLAPVADSPSPTDPNRRGVRLSRWAWQIALPCIPG